MQPLGLKDPHPSEALALDPGYMVFTPMLSLDVNRPPAYERRCCIRQVMCSELVVSVVRGPLSPPK